MVQNGCYGRLLNCDKSMLQILLSEVSFLTFGIVFIRVTCKLIEFIGFLYSGHVTFHIRSGLLKVKETFNGANMAKLQTQGI